MFVVIRIYFDLIQSSVGLYCIIELLFFLAF